MAIKNIHTLRAAKRGPIVLDLMACHTESEIEDLKAALDRLLPEKELTFLALEVADWNRDLSPWEGPAAFGEESFAGHGQETLRQIEEAVLPPLKADKRPILLTGYSLAGLFALWAAYESPAFDGIVCASGSLWFEGWEAYIRTHHLKSLCPVYLSLGGKEERTKNPMMARVGEMTRLQKSLLEKDPGASSVCLEWNPGGHFANTRERLIKGLDYLIKEMEK